MISSAYSLRHSLFIWQTGESRRRCLCHDNFECHEHKRAAMHRSDMSTQTSESKTSHLDSSASATRRVWDLPTRIFHWALVLAVTGAYVSNRAGIEYFKY